MRNKNISCPVLSRIRHVGLRWDMSVSHEACRSLIRHVGLQQVSNQACQSPISLRSGMSVSDGSPIRHVGLCWVSDRSPKIIIFSWTPFLTFFLRNCSFCLRIIPSVFFPFVLLKFSVCSFKIFRLFFLNFPFVLFKLTIL